MSVKKIAIYLPQFHAIPENDKAWGKGFTEWTNVKKAKSLFDTHYQPHVPHESIGYYDLSDPDVLVKQAKLAQENGIYGFAYYHYWFNGTRLLQQPLDNMLQLGKPNMPFCYIWANENWTRRWDGAEHEVIMKQDYSFEDDKEHIAFLCKNVFSDKRYITIDGKPLFLVYRTELFPDIKQTADMWREEVKQYGFNGIYLVRVENFKNDILPETMGFDAAMEFAPDWNCTNKSPREVGNKTLFDYRTTVYNMISQKKNYKYFHCVFPGWDNTARRVIMSGSVFINNDPEVFKYFLETQMMSTIEKHTNTDEQLIFINAWNEWGEGCHLEPDEKNGFKYLDICRQAVPHKINEFEDYFFRQMNEITAQKQKLTKDFEALHSRYVHTLSTYYYKIGKAVFSKLKTAKQWLKGS